MLLVTEIRVSWENGIRHRERAAGRVRDAGMQAQVQQGWMQQWAGRALAGSGPKTAVKSSMLVPWLWAQVGLGRQTNRHHPGACRVQQQRVVQRRQQGRGR